MRATVRGTGAGSEEDGQLLFPLRLAREPLREGAAGSDFGENNFSE